MSEYRIPAGDWLLTETVRLHEERQGRSTDDETANALARAGSPGLASRLARRAAALPEGASIRADLVRLRVLLRRLALTVLALAAVAGALAATASTSEREVDVLLAVFSLLFVPSVMLLVWLVLMFTTRPARASASLSGGLLGIALGRLGPRLLQGPLAAETVSAQLGLLGTGPGRWLLGTLTHLFWTVYSLAALLALSLFFSVAQYDLSWGTTLLSDQSVVRIIESVAAVPAALGLIEAPDPAWIQAGREGLAGGTARAEWARLLLAVVTVYGLLPRLLLALACGLAGVIGLRHVPLDTRRPGYLRLAGTLSDPAQVEVHGEPPEPLPAMLRQRPDDADGPPLLVGIELERSEWPVHLPDTGWQALGRADSRKQRRQILAAVEGFMSPPSALIAQCSALRTPDAGTARFLAQLADAAETVLVVWLDETARLVERGIDGAERIADWQALARRIGGQLVVLDADHPDPAARAELLALAGVSE